MSVASVRGLTSAKPVWLALAPDPVLAFLHLPPSATSRATGVLVCPPFGWDEMCSYRGRRAWADALADAGYPAARIDLPGTGDSGGSATDPGRVGAWTAAVSGSATWLRERTGCDRIAAIGIGLGGMIAWRAIAEGAAIDDLVLWGVADSGKRLLRELRAQHSMIAGRHPDDLRASPPLPDGATEAAGYLLSAETARELGELQLTSLALPGAERRRVLLLRRGRLGVDKRLCEHLEEAGSSVTVAEGLGYDELMAPPQEAKLSAPVIAETLSWLEEGPHGPAIPTAGTTAREVPRVERSSMELLTAGARVRETPLQFEIGSGRLMGVLSEPTADPAEGGLCAVLLNAGALRHVGPSRTWVEIARRWAARGVPTLRVDLEGIGEADGDERRYEDNAGLYVPEMIAQTLAVLDELESRGLSGRFVLVGLCSGANWALHAALAGARVAAALMINLYPIFWNDTLVEEYETRRALASLRGPAWRRIARRDVSLPELRRAVRNVRPDRVLAGPRGRAEFARANDVDRVLDRLRDQGTQALILLGREEPLYDQFVRQGQIDRLDRWPNLTLERLPSTDHSFRALWVQREVHAHLDAALDRALLAAAPALDKIRRQR